MILKGKDSIASIIVFGSVLLLAFNDTARSIVTSLLSLFVVIGVILVGIYVISGSSRK